MGAAKETSRQKMIGMMYLVLTALLALNVSKDVINAFVVVDDNIVQSNMDMSQKLRDTYADFEKNYMLNQIKTKPYWEKAQIARQYSAEMVEYVNKIKYELISKTDGISIEEAKTIKIQEIKGKDNYSIPTNYFLGNSDDGSGGVARELKNKIIEYDEKLHLLIDPKISEHVNLGLSTVGPYYNADKMEQNWETHFFYNTILAADIPILNKIISDVYNAEYDVINLLHKSIGHGDFKFDRIEAKVLSKSDFIFTGEEYNAEIIVAAYDTSQSPEVYYLKGVDYLPVEQYKQAMRMESKPGKINLNFPAGGEGVYKYAGFVRAKTSAGEVNDYPFSGEYVVSKLSYSISAKKMNVFYTGVPNPVSIDISGIPRENLTPSISCGTIKPDPSSNDWIVSIPSGFNEAVISITATINSEKKQMGSKVFRVKKLPDPIASIANKSSGVINRDIMIAAGFISPKMPDDFEFDHSFVINSFTMTIQRGFKVFNFKSNNAYLTSEMTDEIKRTNKGQSVVFENILVRDPEGIDRPIAPIVLTIN